MPYGSADYEQAQDDEIRDLKRENKKLSTKIDELEQNAKILLRQIDLLTKLLDKKK